MNKHIYFKIAKKVFEILCVSDLSKIYKIDSRTIFVVYFTF